jgi:hypothetical protein
MTGDDRSLTVPNVRAIEYDEVEYGRLPANYSAFVITLGCNLFRLSHRADN